MIKYAFFFAFLLLTGCANYKIPFLSSYQKSDIVVRKGDTLYSLAKKRGVSLGSLIKKNNLDPPYQLKIGQILKLPKQTTHKVKKGDTLYSLSKKYDISLAELVRENKIPYPYIISIGQELIVGAEVQIEKIETKKSVQQKKSYSSFPQKKEIVVPKEKVFFIWPVKGKIISEFGSKGHGQYNDGINIATSKGTIIKAAQKGTVAYSGNELKGYGNLILIQHEKGWITAYAHAEKVFVKRGQSVSKGQKIGTVGKTGSVKLPQLHFEVRYKTKVVNPKKYLH